MTGLELILATHLLLTPVNAQAPGNQIQSSGGLSATPASCPAQKSARVDVRWRSEPVKYDHTKSIAQLGSGHIDSENPYGVHVSTDVGGLMSGKVQYKSGIQISSLRYPTSRVTCLWIDKITVDIVIDPTIQIASEHAKGSCKYVAILEHESKHVAIDRAVVQAHINDIRQAASQAVQKVGVVGPKPDATTDDYKKKMSAYVEGALKVAVDAMYAERTQRQKAFDSKEEYDRVAAKCPGQ